MAVTGSFRLAPALINYDVTFRWAVGYTRQITVVGLVARFFLLFDVVFVLCPLSSIKETGGCVPRRVSGSGSLIYLSRKLEKRTPGQVTCLTAPRLTRLCKTGAPIISGDAREGARTGGCCFWHRPVDDSLRQGTNSLRVYATNVGGEGQRFRCTIVLETKWVW